MIAPLVISVISRGHANASLALRLFYTRLRFSSQEVAAACGMLYPRSIRSEMSGTFDLTTSLPNDVTQELIISKIEEYISARTMSEPLEEETLVAAVQASLPLSTSSLSGIYKWLQKVECLPSYIHTPHRIVPASL